MDPDMNMSNQNECAGDFKLKTDYEGHMECKLRELGAKIDEMHAKASEMTAKAADAACDAKDQATVKLQELNEKRETATKRFGEVKDASGEAWTEFKGGLDKAFDELKQAWEELRGGSEKAADKFTH